MLKTVYPKVVWMEMPTKDHIFWKLGPPLFYKDMFLFELCHSGCELWGFKSPHNSQLALGLLVVGQDLSSQLLIQRLPIDC